MARRTMVMVVGLMLSLFLVMTHLPRDEEFRPTASDRVYLGIWRCLMEEHHMRSPRRRVDLEVVLMRFGLSKADWEAMVGASGGMPDRLRAELELQVQGDILPHIIEAQERASTPFDSTRWETSAARTTRPRVTPVDPLRESDSGR